MRNQHPASTEDSIEFQFQKLWVDESRGFQRFSPSNVWVDEEFFRWQVRQGLEPSSCESSSHDCGAQRGVGTRHLSENCATILETKADPGDYGRLMLVTRNLNCSVLPAIGWFPLLPYAFSGGITTSFSSFTFIPIKASSKP